MKLTKLIAELSAKLVQEGDIEVEYVDAERYLTDTQEITSVTVCVAKKNCAQNVEEGAKFIRIG